MADRASRPITCYAEGRDGRWEAICLDLAVQGRSFEEVRKELEQAVADYLAYVGTLPEPERARFLGRRAPAAVRLRATWRMLKATWAELFSPPDEKEWHGFSIPRPA